MSAANALQVHHLCLQSEVAGKNTMVIGQHADLWHGKGPARVILPSLAQSSQVMEKQAALAALQAQVNGATLATATNRGLIVDMQARDAGMCMCPSHRPATCCESTQHTRLVACG